MPAYFNITVEFSRDEINGRTVDVLFKHLQYAGLSFVSGYPAAEGEDLSSIISRDQQLLEDNYEPSAEDDRSEGYKQVLFSLEGFSGARGIIFNGLPCSGEYVFELLIPEEEVLEDGEGGSVFRRDAAERLIKLAKGIWLDPSVKSIQTGLEKHDMTVTEADIISGSLPQMHPFAIVSELHFGRLDCTGLETEHFFPGGVVLKRPLE